MVDSFVDTPYLKKMGPRDGCGRALDTALDDMYMCSFAPVHGDDQSEAYVMIDKAIELVVDDAHIEKMDVASKDVEHLEAASKFVDSVHEQQQLDEEQDKRIVKLSVTSRRRRVIKEALSQALDKTIDALLDSAGDTEMKLLTKFAVKLIQSKKKKLPHQLLKEAEAETDELVKRAAARECGMVRPPTAATVSWRCPKPVQSPVTQKRAYVCGPYRKRDGPFQVQWM